MMIMQMELKSVSSSEQVQDDSLSYQDKDLDTDPYQRVFLHHLDQNEQ